jgi:hypothetical protein
MKLMIEEMEQEGILSSIQLVHFLKQQLLFYTVRKKGCSLMVENGRKMREEKERKQMIINLLQRIRKKYI